jgi:hypothetical protein
MANPPEIPFPCQSILNFAQGEYKPAADAVRVEARRKSRLEAILKVYVEIKLQHNRENQVMTDRGKKNQPLG